MTRPYGQNRMAKNHSAMSILKKGLKYWKSFSFGCGCFYFVGVRVSS